MESYSRYIGQIFDKRYKIERVVGVGGMAVVFSAVDLLMRRTVAIKMLRDENVNDEQAVKRFINESKAVAMLSHENIVNIYDVSVSDSLKYIVMEYIEGVTLKSYIKQKGALSFREIISFTEQILRALDHAHSRGVIHRDIKPQNIMLLKNGQIKVADFGIAKLPNAETVTMSDKAIGTVYYISPEQARGDQIDQRSDLYSLGVMMYEMATGKLPFEAENTVSIALMQINNSPRHPRELNRKIPVGLEQIILTAMKKDPEERFQSAADFLEAVKVLHAKPDYVFPSSPKDKVGGGRKKPKKSTMLPIVLGAAMAFLVTALVCGIYILGVLISGSGNESEDVTIPTFTGSVWDKNAEAAIDTEIFTVKVSYEYNDENPAGVIISQSPNPGETRSVIRGKLRTTVRLTVSRGTEELLMGNYTMMDHRTAEIELRRAGYIVTVTEEYDDTIPEGYVIKTDPGRASSVTYGQAVTLYVSLGEEIIYIDVPDLVGKTEIVAYRQLTASGLLIGKVTYTQSAESAGKVLKQSLEPGEKVPTGVTKIDIVISGGPSYGVVTLPPVTLDTPVPLTTAADTDDGRSPEEP